MRKFTRPEILTMLTEAAGYLRNATDERRRTSWSEAIDRLLDELNAQKGISCNPPSPKNSGGQSKPPTGADAKSKH